MSKIEAKYHKIEKFKQTRNLNKLQADYIEKSKSRSKC